MRWLIQWKWWYTIMIPVLLCLNVFLCMYQWNLQFYCQIWNLNLFMYFQIIYLIIMAKTSRTGRTLKETDRWGYDPATHITNIAKTLKCKVMFIWYLIYNLFDFYFTGKKETPSLSWTIIPCVVIIASFSWTNIKNWYFKLQRKIKKWLLMKTKKDCLVQ